MKRAMGIVTLLTLLVVVGIALPAQGKGLSGKDKGFVKDAALGGMLEVQMGEMAQGKAESKDVKAFASQMFKDHSNINDELQRTAQPRGITLPTELGKNQKSLLDDLRKRTGPDFDKTYMQYMVTMHVKDVGNFREAAQKAKDPDVKTWATKTVPILQQHLEHAREIARKVGVDVNKAEQEGQKAIKKM